MHTHTHLVFFIPHSCIFYFFFLKAKENWEFNSRQTDSFAVSANTWNLSCLTSVNGLQWKKNNPKNVKRRFRNEHTASVWEWMKGSNFGNAVESRVDRKHLITSSNSMLLLVLWQFRRWGKGAVQSVNSWKSAPFLDFKKLSQHYIYGAFSKYSDGLSHTIVK